MGDDFNEYMLWCAIMGYPKTAAQSRSEQFDDDLDNENDGDWEDDDLNNNEDGELGDLSDF